MEHTGTLVCPKCGCPRFITFPDGANSWLLECSDCGWEGAVQFPPNVTVKMYEVETGPDEEAF